MRKILFCMALALFLAVFAHAVVEKENQLAHGEIIILKLAPVDPRSLMQGDYMVLNFDISNDIRKAVLGKRNAKDLLLTDEGMAIISRDADNLAKFVRLDDGSGLGQNELHLSYRIRNGQIRIASGSFFFQEGHGKAYEKAVYGELRLDSKSNPLVRHLLDEKRQIIQGIKEPLKD